MMWIHIEGIQPNGEMTNDDAEVIAKLSNIHLISEMGNVGKIVLEFVTDDFITLQNTVRQGL